jgi:hypothetical protein
MAASLVLALAPAAAGAWEKKAELEVQVHDHAFSKVSATSVGECALELSVHFGAPAERYGAGKGHYKFRARVELSGGKRVTSPVFMNRAPGRRVYRFTFDTTGEGCWAKQEHKIFDLDVEGCRGRGCKVEPFH